MGGKIAQLGARLIDATSKQMADMFFDRFSAAVAPAPAAVVDDTPASVATDGPIGAIAALTGDAASTGRPASAPVVPSGAPKLSVLDLIPAEPFGLPRVATIGIVLWLLVFFLVFKSYVGL